MVRYNIEQCKFLLRIALEERNLMTDVFINVVNSIQIHFYLAEVSKMNKSSWQAE
jgi:hypothetical protein